MAPDYQYWLEFASIIGFVVSVIVIVIGIAVLIGTYRMYGNREMVKALPVFIIMLATWWICIMLAAFPAAWGLAHAGPGAGGESSVPGLFIGFLGVVLLLGMALKISDALYSTLSVSTPPKRFIENIEKQTDPKALLQELRKCGDVRVHQAILKRLTDLGEASSSVLPELNEMLKEKKKSMRFEAWLRWALYSIEKNEKDNVRAIVDFLKNEGNLIDFCKSGESGDTGAAVEALTAMGDVGTCALLSIMRDSTCRSEGRSVAENALEKQFPKIKDVERRFGIVSSLIEAIVDEDIVSRRYALRALSGVTGRELDAGSLKKPGPKEKEAWSKWWSEHKEELRKQWSPV